MTARSTETREFVSRIESGDRDAESELIQQFSQPLKLILFKRTGNAQLTKDLCQDTFVVTLKRLRAGGLKNPQSLAAFIRQTAVNLCIDHYRKEKRYIHLEDGIISLDHFHKDHVEREIDNEATRELLEHTLDQLAVTRDREILRRFYLADEDKANICRDLNLSSVHFDRVVYRARRRMRELINQQKGLKAMLFGGLFDG